MSNEHALYSVEAIRNIEQAALHALPPFTLMQRAAQSAASLARKLLANGRNEQGNHASPVLILAGPGNNGGDALEMATLLAKDGCDVTILLTAEPATLPPDARKAYEHALSATVRFMTLNRKHIAQNPWALIVDGLFGIGLTRPIDGLNRQLVETVNALSAPILAFDVPSGLNADTGNVVGGRDGIAIRATHTITFIGNKPGLHTCDGRDHAGEVHVADLDIETALFPPPAMMMNRVELFAAALRTRSHNSHKGSYGDVVVLGGARGMTGAAILSARTAAKCGAGRTFIASMSADLFCDFQQPELMCRSAHDIDFTGKTIVAGPGLGMSRDACDMLAMAMSANAPLVLDADALNLLAAEPLLRQKLGSRTSPTLLTPHPLEAARLLDLSTEQIQTNRIAAARTLATRFNATIILKGSGSIIASPEGRVAINPTGNPALATAGTGDVLSGICGALLAQGYPAWETALAATWLHGMAADELVDHGIGPVGLVASELIDEIRLILNKVLREHAGKSRHPIKPDARPKS